MDLFKDQPLRRVMRLVGLRNPHYRWCMEHHVYFWLKEEFHGEPEQKVFEAGLEALCQSPFIASSHWGKPAETSERPVTDHSWSYGLSLKFDSMEKHDRYQEGDPVHDEFIAKFKDRWAKVLVMDLA